MNKRSNVKSNVSKMFNVLVVGGTMMAASSALAADPDPTTKEETCNLELQEKSTNKVICLDELSTAKLRMVTLYQALNCADLNVSCPCWPG